MNLLANELQRHGVVKKSVPRIFNFMKNKFAMQNVNPARQKTNTNTKTKQLQKKKFSMSKAAHARTLGHACYIGEHGYTVRKEIAAERGLFADAARRGGPDSLEALRAALTVSPVLHGAPEFVKPRQFAVFKETDKKLYLPRFRGLDWFGPPVHNMLGDDLVRRVGRPVERMAFARELRPEQLEIVQETVAILQDPQRGNSGILQLPCGFGKTVMALNLASRLGVRTIIVVSKSFLMKQWEKSIHEFIPNARVGIIRSDRAEVDDDKDIVIGMLHSLCGSREYAPGTLQGFGMSIYDECHHLGAETFSNALSRINTYYQLGLSATPDRADGLSRVFEWYLGPVIVRRAHVVRQHVVVRQVTWCLPPSDAEQAAQLQKRYENDRTRKRGKYMEFIAECQSRTLFVADIVVKLFLEDPQHRKILVLSERCQTLLDLENAVRKRLDKCEPIDLPPSLASRRKSAAKGKSKGKSKGKCDNTSDDTGNGRGSKQKKTAAAAAKAAEDAALAEDAAAEAEKRHNAHFSVAPEYPTTGFYWGRETCQDNLDRAALATFVFGTYQVASEGMDVPELNAVVFLTPKSDIEQSVGRIFRKIHDLEPVVIDIIDADFASFTKTRYGRQAFYRKCGFEVQIDGNTQSSSSSPPPELNNEHNNGGGEGKDTGAAAGSFMFRL